MSKEFFCKVNFHGKTLELIDQANEILQEYAAQGFTLTLRQLYYQFVARQVIANHDKEYGRLGRTIVDARRAGLVNWEHIEDRTRDLSASPHWENPAEILYSAARSYREDPWDCQGRRLEVWVEKAALAGVIEPVCERWRIPYMAARGYPSHSELYAAGKRFSEYIDSGFTSTVFYLGDHDPSGVDMSRSLELELSLYARTRVEVFRLGLNIEQVRQLALPPNPAKETDKRYHEYVRTTGQTDSWELDALSPAYIGALVDRAVDGLVDHETWQKSLDREQANKDLLRQTARSFGAGSSP